MYDPIDDTDELQVRHYCLVVNGKPFVVEYPDEPMIGVKGNKLITLGSIREKNYWNAEDIKGYYA